MEILLAVFVLALTTTASTSLLIQSGRTANNTQKQFQARYLAREAFEMLKMIRDTNWIRFSDKGCWDIKFDTKSCAKQNPESIQDGNYGLVMNTAQDMYMRLAEVADDSKDNCQNFDALVKSPYAVYQNKTDNPDNAYNGVMFSTDGAPPANSIPVYCRKITLKKVDPNAIKVDVTMTWKIGSQKNSTTISSYLRNY